MIFYQHVMDAAAYIISRSYAVWFFSVPVAFGIVFLIFDVLRFGGARR